MIDLKEQVLDDVNRKTKKLEEKSDKMDKEYFEVDLEDVSEKDEVISFDTYFVIRLKQVPGTLPHHKAPIKAYVEKKMGTVDGTKKQFDEILKSY